MLQDLEVLTPPLVVCAAFVIGLVMFLRRQLSAKQHAGEQGQADFPDDTRNAADEDASSRSSSRGITR